MNNQDMISVEKNIQIVRVIGLILHSSTLQGQIGP